MKNSKIVFLLVLIPLSIILTAGSIDINKASRDELKRAFDVIIQNYGALEFAYYTFTLEFERPPANFTELKNSGHLTVLMKDPYTDGDVKVVDSMPNGKAGNLLYNKNSKNSAEFACFYANPNNPKNMRWLHSDIKIYTHEALHEAVFNDKASREEKLTRVYLLQLDDAVESFRQKIGRMPESVKEMAEKGDVNVSYINPFTGELAKQSEILSPGDYFYRRFTKKAMHQEPKRQPDGKLIMQDVEREEDFYEVIGWGKTEPVYYFSNDRTKENLEWEESMSSKNILSILDSNKENEEK